MKNLKVKNLIKIKTSVFHSKSQLLQFSNTYPILVQCLISILPYNLCFLMFSGGIETEHLAKMC